MWDRPTKTSATFLPLCLRMCRNSYQQPVWILDFFEIRSREQRHHFVLHKKNSPKIFVYVDAGENIFCIDWLSITYNKPMFVCFLGGSCGNGQVSWSKPVMNLGVAPLMGNLCVNANCYLQRFVLIPCLGISHIVFSEFICSFEIAYFIWDPSKINYTFIVVALLFFVCYCKLSVTQSATLQVHENHLDERFVMLWVYSSKQDTTSFRNLPFSKYGAIGYEYKSSK